MHCCLCENIHILCWSSLLWMHQWFASQRNHHKAWPWPLRCDLDPGYIFSIQCVCKKRGCSCFCTLVDVEGTLSSLNQNRACFLCLINVSANQRRRYFWNVVSHWPVPCWEQSKMETENKPIRRNHPKSCVEFVIQSLEKILLFN